MEYRVYSMLFSTVMDLSLLHILNFMVSTEVDVGLLQEIKCVVSIEVDIRFNNKKKKNKKIKKIILQEMDLCGIQGVQYVVFHSDGP